MLTVNYVLYLPVWYNNLDCDSDIYVLSLSLQYKNVNCEMC